MSTIKFSEINCTVEEFEDLFKKNGGYTHDEVKKFVVGYYRHYTELDLSNIIYVRMLQISIRANDLAAWEILVQGIYYHDRDNPNYASNVRYGAEYADLKFFLHILTAYATYNTLNPQPDIIYDDLLDLAKQNPDRSVLEFIIKLKDVLISYHSYSTPDQNYILTHRGPVPDKILIISENFAYDYIDEIRVI
jgi:hypothetical protein